MKQVIAFIRPSKEDAVCQALQELPQVSGASFSDVRGFGRGRLGRDQREFNEALVGALPRVRVDVMAPAIVVDAVVKTILTAAHTGKRGDGKIYVQSIDSAVRISTQESGAAAV